MKMENNNERSGYIYDIDGTAYEITNISFKDNKVVLPSVNDDTHITCKLDDFDFDDSI